MKRSINLALTLLAIFLLSGCSKDSPPTYGPVPGTVEILQVTTSTAFCQVDIVNDGGAAITEKGVCWNTSGNPTVADFKTNDGSGNDDFQSHLTGLDSSTRYFVRAYAVNSVGIRYGQIVAFVTPPHAIPIVIGASRLNSMALRDDSTYVSWPSGMRETPFEGGAGFVGSDPGGNTTGVPRQHDVILDQYKSIASGFSYTLGLKEDGSLWAWGMNDVGQLGDGTFSRRDSAIQIGSNYIAIAAGDFHSLAIKADGTLWGWGDNSFGQAGIGNGSAQQNIPIQIGSDFKIICAGTGHSLGIKEDNTLWAWGRNLYGQLGDGSQDSSYVMLKIGDDFIAVDAGHNHSMAMKADGMLYAWGSNQSGQLAPGISEIQNRPIAIASDFVLFAAGSAHSVGVKADGSLWCWGITEYNISPFGGSDPTIDQIPIRIYLE